jgi:hypothetical protein
MAAVRKRTVMMFSAHQDAEGEEKSAEVQNKTNDQNYEQAARRAMQLSYLETR